MDCKKGTYIDLISVWTIGYTLSEVMQQKVEDIIEKFNVRYSGENRNAQIGLYISVLKQHSENSLLSSSDRKKITDLIESLSSLR